MAYTALDIAKYIVNKCTLDGSPVSNLKLQWILYWIQREFLRRGGPAFPEDMEARLCGPVLPAVHYEFCCYGGLPIWPPMDRLYDVRLSPDFRAVADPIIEEKRTLPMLEAAKEVQRPGQAWAKIYDGGWGNRCVIPKALIRADSLKGDGG